MTSQTQTPAWQALQSLANQHTNITLTDYVAKDKTREQTMQAAVAGITLNYSYQAIDNHILTALNTLLTQSGFTKWREQLLTGAPVNHTENRAALHTAIRAEAHSKHVPQTIVQEVLIERERMLKFAQAVRSGEYTNKNGKPFTDILVLGIGGSHLGPELVCRALTAYVDGPRVTFVSNVDGANLAYALRGLQAENTLVIVPSKSFTTDETLTNLATVRAWLTATLGEAQAQKQVAACSSKPDAAAANGILPELHFRLWDWVGGRYSLWSSVGLPIAIATGVDHFRALLSGAREMDEHFASAPLEQNIPVLLGMLGIWNRNFLNIPTHAVLPYAEGLSWLPKHLQQLEMESTGKHVDRDGNTLTYPTCPVIWGDAGTNGQHAFHQWLHQGTDRISLDFIGVKQPMHDFGILGERKLAHHNRMLANGYAQRKALAFGTAQLGTNDSPLAKHQACDGNRPSNLLLLETTSPHTVGALIAAYEHKVFTQAVVWNINPFDQWGVEIGKVLAKQLLPTLGSS